MRTKWITQGMLKVLVVDDQALIRRGLTEILSESEGLIVVGQAADGAEAVVKAKELEPDVVVMDLSMPNVNGLEATRQLQVLDPRPSVLVVTVSEKEHDLSAALEAGASGYVLNNVTPEELVRAVTHVAAGGVLASPSMASTMLSRFKGAASEHAAEDQDSTANGPDRSEAESQADLGQRLGGIDQALGPLASDELYEGTVRLRVKASGPDLFSVVQFVARLRLMPELRVLRVETTEKGHADILLGLRTPLRIRELMLYMAGVSEASASASFPAGSDEPLVSVRLDTKARRQEAAAAHQYVSERGSNGKVVLKP